MNATETTERLGQTSLIATLLLLGACGRPPEVAAADQEESTLPPAIIAPSEIDPPSPPSYEVGIASAAADRNLAREKCAEKSERLRALCEAEADAAFAQAEADLADLRGNQP